MRSVSSLLMGVLAALTLALGAMPARAQSASNMATGPWTNAGIPAPPQITFRPTGDPDIDFILRDGVRGQQFVESCASFANGQRYNQASPLPVGNGWVLSCNLQPSILVAEQFLMGRDNRLWCWRGGAASYRWVSDPQLRVQVTPGVWGQSYWWLQGWSNQPGWVRPISVQGAQTWPLWLEISYQTIAIAPAVNSRCDGVLPPLR